LYVDKKVNIILQFAFKHFFGLQDDSIEELAEEAGKYHVVTIKAYGSFHAQSPKNCKEPPQILTKFGVFRVLMVLITHSDF